MCGNCLLGCFRLPISLCMRLYVCLTYSLLSSLPVSLVSLSDALCLSAFSLSPCLTSYLPVRLSAYIVCLPSCLSTVYQLIACLAASLLVLACISACVCCLS